MSLAGIRSRYAPRRPFSISDFGSSCIGYTVCQEVNDDGATNTRLTCHYFDPFTHRAPSSPSVFTFLFAFLDAAASADEPSTTIEESSPIVKQRKDQIIFTADGLRRLTELGSLEKLTITSPLPLTTYALAALSKMPALRHVELRGIDFDADSLAWIRTTPQLERLRLLDGTISADALADLVHARMLTGLALGDEDAIAPISHFVFTHLCVSVAP